MNQVAGVVQHEPAAQQNHDRRETNAQRKAENHTGDDGTQRNKAGNGQEGAQKREIRLGGKRRKSQTANQ